MIDKMTFPCTFMEFIKNYTFEDDTNGIELVPFSKVEQGWEHYTMQLMH